MQQWMRYCDLVVSGQGNALNFSQMRISFQIQKTENETPNQAQIKIYNLTPDTENQIIKEFTRVTLQAGYQDHYGVIFDGTITQSHRGREGVDSFIELSASDGDQAYNNTLINVTLQAGSCQADHINALTSAMGIKATTNNSNIGGALPRGKVMFGNARDHMRTSAYSNDQNWSIQDGSLQLLSKKSLLPTEAILLNSQTGLIGGAQQSTAGIKARCLLNPMFRIGAHVIINETDVMQAKLSKNKAPTKKSDGSVDATVEADKLAIIAKDGSYKIIGTIFEGDTYGNDWFTEVTCIDVDATVKKAGA